MGQLGFFDADKRLAAISAKGDPLEMIDRVVPFESFRAEIEAVVLTPAEDKKSNAGRKPTDVIVMFRMLVLQSLYNLSDVLDRQPSGSKLRRLRLTTHRSSGQDSPATVLARQTAREARYRAAMSNHRRVNTMSWPVGSPTPGFSDPPTK
jgi:hypothetical protein